MDWAALFPPLLFRPCDVVEFLDLLERACVLSLLDYRSSSKFPIINSIGFFLGRLFDVFHIFESLILFLLMFTRALLMRSLVNELLILIAASIRFARATQLTRRQGRLYAAMLYRGAYRFYFLIVDSFER